MYALVDGDGQIVTFPYSLTNLMRDRRDVSWPRRISDELAARFNCVRVEETAPPAADHTETVVEDPPVKVNGQWVRQWRKRATTPVELDERTAKQAAIVMAERDKRIQAFFWAELLAPTVNAGQYRQHLDALRDVPQQAGYPFDITWPVKP